MSKRFWRIHGTDTPKNPYEPYRKRIADLEREIERLRERSRQGAEYLYILFGQGAFHSFTETEREQAYKWMEKERGDG